MLFSLGLQNADISDFNSMPSHFINTTIKMGGIHQNATPKPDERAEDLGMEDYRTPSRPKVFLNYRKRTSFLMSI